MNNDRRKQLAALLDDLQQTGLRDADGMAERFAELLALLREYLELQSTETDHFILQCRRDELRTLLAKL